MKFRIESRDKIISSTINKEGKFSSSIFTDFILYMWTTPNINGKKEGWMEIGQFTEESHAKAYAESVKKAFEAQTRLKSSVYEFEL